MTRPLTDGQREAEHWIRVWAVANVVNQLPVAAIREEPLR